METFAGTPNLQGLAFSSQSDGPCVGLGRQCELGFRSAPVEAFIVVAGWCPQLKRGSLGRPNSDRSEDQHN